MPTDEKPDAEEPVVVIRNPVLENVSKAKALKAHEKRAEDYLLPIAVRFVDHLREFHTPDRTIKQGSSLAETDYEAQVTRIPSDEQAHIDVYVEEDDNTVTQYSVFFLRDQITQHSTRKR